MSRKSKITAVILLLILIAAFCAVYLVFKPSVTAGEKAFTVKVVHADRSEKTFSYRCSDEYLGDTLLREGLIKGEKGAYGIYITEVDGERAVYEHDKAYWALFINGEYAVSGIDATPIENGAQYTLAYTVG